MPKSRIERWAAEKGPVAGRHRFPHKLTQNTFFMFYYTDTSGFRNCSAVNWNQKLFTQKINSNYKKKNESVGVQYVVNSIINDIIVIFLDILAVISNSVLILTRIYEYNLIYQGLSK